MADRKRTWLKAVPRLTHAGVSSGSSDRYKPTALDHEEYDRWAACFDVLQAVARGPPIKARHSRSRLTWPREPYVLPKIAWRHSTQGKPSSAIISHLLTELSSRPDLMAIPHGSWLNMAFRRRRRASRGAASSTGGSLLRTPAVNSNISIHPLN